MTTQELQEVRAVPLFSGLEDRELGCIDGGQIVRIAAGESLAADGERTVTRASGSQTNAVLRVRKRRSNQK